MSSDLEHTLRKQEFTGRWMVACKGKSEEWGEMSLGRWSGARARSLDFILRAVGSLGRFLSREVRWSDFYTKQGSELFKKRGSEFRLPWVGFPALSLSSFELQASYLPPMFFSFPVWRWEMIVMVIRILHICCVGWWR